MKRLLIFIITLAAMFSADAKGKHLLEFAEEIYNFGTVTESSKPVVHEYEFTNTADEPVAVMSVSAACGCTQPEYPVKPLMPGEKGIIKVTFNPEGQKGEVDKEILVRYRGAKARSANRIALRLRGSVIP